MKFRPCIDIHNGNVKQIVGGSLSDKNNYAVDNFVSEYDGAYYGKLYKSYGLTGGHIIILNPVGSEFYNADLEQAYSALSAFEGGLQIGGGINDENAAKFLEKGASHVIVTSFVFKNGVVNFDNLNRLVKSVGKSRLVLDLSCRKRDGKYYVVTDRWQKFTSTAIHADTLAFLGDFACEFLIHAVDVEGKQAGIDEELLSLLAAESPIPCVYAGGIANFGDIGKIERAGKGRIAYTVGSALDIFGGPLSYCELAAYAGRKS